MTNAEAYQLIVFMYTSNPRVYNSARNKTTTIIYNK